MYSTSTTETLKLFLVENAHFYKDKTKTFLVVGKSLLVSMAMWNKDSQVTDFNGLVLHPNTLFDDLLQWVFSADNIIQTVT